MITGTAKEIMADFRARHIAPKKTDWKKKYREADKAARSSVIDEAITKLRAEARNKPVEWQRGYSSAITVLEIMRGRP